jgi:hypothetical protein
MHKPDKSVRLNCFSPPVMLATFIIEAVLAVYIIWRYRLDMTGRLVVALLSFLALFQISEYFVCGGAGLSAETWAKTGYVAITMLPPLGLHLLHILARKDRRAMVIASYVSAAGFIAFFLGYSGAFTGYMCTGNYVIFQLASHSGMAYGFYYYGWLLAVLGYGKSWLNELKTKGKKYAKQRQTIQALIAGYLVFLVPTAIANTINPDTRRGIPSIMCGFAVIFAVILVVYVLPRAGQRRQGASR